MSENATLCQTEQEARLFEMGAFGFIAIYTDYVNLDDLLHANRPGAIVRCDISPADAIKLYAPAEHQALRCVAGWISEE